MFQVADDGWADVLDWSELNMYGYPRVRDGRVDDYWDTIIEVLDSETGALIATKRLDEQFQGFTRSGRLHRAFADSLGLPRVELVNVDIVRDD